MFDAPFFADIENRIYDVLYALTMVYRPGSGEADCLFEGVFPDRIGKDPANQPTRMMGVLIESISTGTSDLLSLATTGRVAATF